MIELYQLEQLTAFAKHGTLSKAADELHMSQPTLTRSMQKLESEFGVSLFMRSKNRLEFNENGILAAEYAQKVLDQAQNMLDKVRSFDRASHTISIGSCAPMPLITAVQNAARLYPGMTISSECKDCVPLVEGLKTGLYQIIILPYKPDDESLVSIESGSETLFFCAAFLSSFCRQARPVYEGNEWGKYAAVRGYRFLAQPAGAKNAPVLFPRAE